MAYEGFATMSVQVDGGVAVVTIDHPPINLLDLAMIQDLDRLGRQLAADDAVRAAGRRRRWSEASAICWSACARADRSRHRLGHAWVHGGVKPQMKHRTAATAPPMNTEPPRPTLLSGHLRVVCMIQKAQLERRPDDADS